MITTNLYIHETKLRKAIQLWSDMRNFDSFNSFVDRQHKVDISVTKQSYT